MKLITRDTDYAIKAILYIAKQQDKRTSTTDIQKELDLPRPFLRKILQTLQKEGVLSSFKGNKGGFLLAKTPNKISLIDLMKIFQGELTLSECFLQKKICPDILQCSLRKKIKGIEKSVIAELKGITISSLLEYK